MNRKYFMRYSSLALADAYKLDPELYKDGRGYFFETFKRNEFAEATGRNFSVEQTNTSVSKKGTLRGIHFAEIPLGQAKIVSVARGSILDYLVDLRIGSETFGKSLSLPLDDKLHEMVFIPEGFGHGFIALEDETVVNYHVSDIFRPTREHGISPFDEEIGLTFPFRKSELIVSDKDATAPCLQEVLNSGLLPTLEIAHQRYNDQKG